MWEVRYRVPARGAAETVEKFDSEGEAVGYFEIVKTFAALEYARLYDESGGVVAAYHS